MPPPGKTACADAPHRLSRAPWQNGSSRHRAARDTLRWRTQMRSGCVRLPQNPSSASDSEALPHPMAAPTGCLSSTTGRAGRPLLRGAASIRWMVRTARATLSACLPFVAASLALTDRGAACAAGIWTRWRTTTTSTSRCRPAGIGQRRNDARRFAQTLSCAVWYRDQRGRSSGRAHLPMYVHMSVPPWIQFARRPPNRHGLSRESVVSVSLRAVVLSVGVLSEHRGLA